MFVFYNILLGLAALVAVPYFVLKMMITGKYRKSLGPKFGFNRPEVFEDMKGSPRIWVHAVSVGEVTAAAPIVASLREHFPDACIVLSTGTETGQEMARRIVPQATAFIYYPLDIPWVVRKVIHQVNPDIFIPTETELWPNFIRICRDSGVKMIMVNGRISPRSFKRYAMTRFFWKRVLRAIDEIGVISEVDAERLKIIGMPPFRVHVLGNAKYDSLAAKASPVLQEEISRKLNIPKGDKVFVAGSTHEGEESIVLAVFARLLKVYPEFKLIIIPRHIERGQAVLAMLRGGGFEDSITMTEIESGRRRVDERVVVIDVIGELFKVYSLATVVFCGGSLVPKGGQNILEPAAWGKVIFYGPFMDDFRDEKGLLEKSGAGITVRNAEELLAGILKTVSDPEELVRRGERGRSVLVANMGAAERYAEMIRSHIKHNSSQNSERDS
jgi:3-deoxy-D-manno-octulosonic-acid transferase